MSIASALVAIYAIVVLSILALVFRHFHALETAKRLKRDAPPTAAQAPPSARTAQPDNAEEEEVTEFTLAVAGRPLLRITSGAGSGAKDFFLSPIGVTTIGRGADNDIVIPGDAASTRHCHIEKKGGAYVLIDDGSTNRTWVNGAEKQRVVLRNGDQIKVGETTMVFALFGDRG